MVRAGIDLDLRGAARRVHGRLELVLDGQVLLVVIVGDGDQELGRGLGQQQVRTGRLVGVEAAAVEACDATDPARDRRGRAERQRAAHAVALHPDLLLAAGLELRVEEADIGDRITVDAVWRQAGAERAKLGAVLRLVEVERALDHRRALDPVVGVRNQHDIALAGQSTAHVAERLPEADDVGPEQHGGPAALAFGIVEGRVGDAVGGLYVHFLLDHRDGGAGRTGGAGGGHGHQAEGTAGDGGVHD